jgi:hypothetical protein
MEKLYEKVLALEESGQVDYEIGYRGGHYGLPRSEACELLGIEGGYSDYLPAKVGVYCNYLGGGLRGAIVWGGYGKIPEKYAKRLDSFYRVCKKRYLEIENGMNDEVDSEGNENWDAIGTRKMREAGVESGY